MSGGMSANVTWCRVCGVHVADDGNAPECRGATLCPCCKPRPVRTRRPHQ
jgi:hypothetical protein